MSKTAATLLVGLLALAEGRSNDMDYLREADREDMMDMIEPEMLDRIAQRLYAEDEEHMSAYDRLLDDKRKKMDYLNNIRPDLIPENREHHQERHHEAEEADRHHNDHVQDRDGGQTNEIGDLLKRTDRTHEKLARQKAKNEEDKHYALMEKE